MMTIDLAGKDVSSAYDCHRSRSPDVEDNNLPSGDKRGVSPLAVGEMVQHMLRNILQAGERKKELADVKLSNNNNEASPDMTRLEDEQEVVSRQNTCSPIARTTPAVSLLKSDLKPSRVDEDRPTPLPTLPVNGCKKRKLYQPQQHGMLSDLEQPPASDDIKTSLKNELRLMQQQLAEMRHKYSQLYTTNIQSEPEDNSDLDSTPSPSHHKSPLTAPSSPVSLATIPHLYPAPPHPQAALYQMLLADRMADAIKPSSPTPQASPEPLPPASKSLSDSEALAAALKSEINASMTNLMNLIDRFVQTKPHSGKSSLLKTVSAKIKVLDRGPVLTNSSPYLENNLNAINLPSSRFGSNRQQQQQQHNPSKITSSNIDHIAAALYSSHLNGFSLGPSAASDPLPPPEQNEALSLVVGPQQKKKRHKVTDTRTTPRTLSRILGQQDSSSCPPSSNLGVDPSANKYGMPESQLQQPPFHLASAALGVSLPTSVAIPNPSLNESRFFSSYSPFYGQQSSHSEQRLRDSPPLHHHSIFHAGLLAAVQQQQQQQHRVNSPPDYTRSTGSALEALEDHVSECTSMEYDGTTANTVTLSPMHLRKAKLMFFWARYPSSNALKMYFPDIKFNKNNTAQLVKWFSNFREFYYMQMEKHARTAIADGINNVDDLHVSLDCDIYRNLNQHYNRNNHIEVPHNFRYVVEQTLKEFFKAIQGGKDQEQSWKKPIYKVINRLDDNVPEYFKTPNFLEQLE